MSRQLRVQFPGALYHVTTRGNQKCDIFIDDSDRASMLERLRIAVTRHDLICHAFCLMNNHYHVLIETPEGNLSDGMRDLNGTYAARFNHRHGRSGHLLQGRYWATLIDKDSYFLAVARYIVLNPVRAMQVDSLEKWPWTSFRATAGMTRPPSFLETDFTLAMFSEQRQRAQSTYIEFVDDSAASPTLDGNISERRYVGTPCYLQRVSQQFGLDLAFLLEDVLEDTAPKDGIELGDIIAGFRDSRERNAAIVRAYLKHGFKMRDIAQHLGLSLARVSQIISQECGQTRSGNDVRDTVLLTQGT